MDGVGVVVPTHQASADHPCDGVHVVTDSIEHQLRSFRRGQARRSFDHLPARYVDRELVRTLEAPDTLHLLDDVLRR